MVSPIHEKNRTLPKQLIKIYIMKFRTENQKTFQHERRRETSKNGTHNLTTKQIETEARERKTEVQHKMNHFIITQ